MLAIGLMSGTSLDAVDAALIETDGRDQVRAIAHRAEPWSDAARAELLEATALARSFDRPRASPPIVAAEALVTRAHVFAVRKLMKQAGVSADDIGVIGFHGQTIAHRPERGWSWQIGDGAALAKACGVTVVGDFRAADCVAGGQGAPLIPVYHAALASAIERPVVLLNLGGVANITFVPAQGPLIAFDTGPANGMLDQWVAAQTGARFDAGGELAASGRVDERIAAGLLADPYFMAPAPKSLDRFAFPLEAVAGLSPADGAATLTAFTALAIAAGLRQLPESPRRLIAVGGGRHNPVMLRAIAAACGIDPEPGEALGLNGDATEAEGFAYMAVRRLSDLPISFPGTTGVPEPMTGGVIYHA